MNPDDIDHDAPVIAHLERIISAPVNRVWALHTDIARWPKWQKDISATCLGGLFVPDASFTWTAKGLDEPVTSTIYAVEPERSTLWGGPSAGITGVHRWTFTAISEGTKVVTEESWAGDPIAADPIRAKQMLDDSLIRWLGFLEEAVASA